MCVGFLMCVFFDVCVVDVFVVHMCECVSMDVCGCGWCGFDVFFRVVWNENFL